MRMWGVNTEYLCRKHLLGEHVETHMLIGALRHNKSISGYTSTGLIQIDKVISRHNELVKEIEIRGYNHKSPIGEEDSLIIKNYVGDNGYIDVNQNLKTLSDRCTECRERIKLKRGLEK